MRLLPLSASRIVSRCRVWFAQAWLFSCVIGVLAFQTASVSAQTPENPRLEEEERPLLRVQPSVEKPNVEEAFQKKVPAPSPPLLAPESGESTDVVKPFGSNLFIGNFLRAREDGLNPAYVITPGGHVAVNTWGAVRINEVFVVDSQGNIFLPEVGPIQLAGVRNAALTENVRQGLKKVYARYFDVYTNLITAKPVAVYVTGGVTRPGRYAGIPSDSVLFFLDQASGIDPQLGSYRNISILRNGQSI